VDNWLEKVTQVLPGILPAREYIDRTSAAAGLLGFHLVTHIGLDHDGTIGCVRRPG